MYARNGNPNQHWLEEKVAALHNADDAIVLASGVAALHALFWTLLKTGDRVVYPKVSYMAVYRLFHELFNNKFGVETVMVDMTDLDAVKKGDYTGDASGPCRNAGQSDRRHLGYCGHRQDCP